MDTIIQHLVKTAYKYPKNKAVADANGWYSYERLETITDVLAQTIIRRAERLGIVIPELIIEGKSGPRIAVIMPRTKDFLVASIGVLKAGCPIVPIEPDYPTDRIRTILEDSKCQQIVTTEEVLREIASRPEGNAIEELGYGDDTISFMSNVIEMAPAKLHVSTFDLSQNDNEGLIIYTSGSTGKPKGVVHTQNVFTVGIRAYKTIELDVNPSTSFACMAGFTFIASLIDLYTPLAYGGSVYIVNGQERLDIRQMRDIIVSNNINYMFMPPKLAGTMISTFGDMGMSAIVCAGEKLLNRPVTNVKIVDTYGTSETGGAIIRVAQDGDSSSVLGNLLVGNKAVLIDSDGNKITKPGVVGEFCLISETLAMGYNNMPELTAEKFVPCPFLPGERMFKTGDLMAYTESGEFEFHGRSDYMVKLNGFRVELGEVESVISKHDSISEVACVLKKVNGGDNLCLYYVTKDGNAMSEDELKGFGAQKLASYMIPSIYIHMDKLPRNANGKIDRKNLPEPQTEAHEYVAPSTPTEEKLQAIIAGILGLETTQVGVTTELLTLGLNSILGMQTIVKVSQEFKLKLNLKTLLAMGNIQMTADLIDSGSLQPYQEFKPYPKQKSYPATKGMLGYMKGDSEGYATLVVFTIYRIEGMTLRRMIPALNAVVKAHPSINIHSGYDMQGNALIYRDDDADFPFKQVTLDYEPDKEWLRQNCMGRTRVVGGQMVAITLVETPNYGYFSCYGSHSILDGAALSLLFHDFCTALAGGTIEPEKYTIFDYAIDEDKYYKSKQRLEDEAYYKNLVGRKLETMISFDKEPEVEDWIEARISFTWDKAAVDRFCMENQVQQNSFYGAVFMQSLAQMTGKPYIMTSSLHSNRSDATLARILNLTMRNYPILSDHVVHLKSQNFLPRMCSEMRAVQNQVARATELQFYDYYSMVGMGSKSKNSTGKSIFLDYVGMLDKLLNPEEERTLLGCDIESLDITDPNIPANANDALSSNMFVNADGQYEVVVKYNHKCYHTATIQKFADIMNEYYRKLTNG